MSTPPSNQSNPSAPTPSQKAAGNTPSKKVSRQQTTKTNAQISTIFGKVTITTSTNTVLTLVPTFVAPISAVGIPLKVPVTTSYTSAQLISLLGSPLSNISQIINFTFGGNDGWYLHLFGSDNFTGQRLLLKPGDTLTVPSNFTIASIILYPGKYLYGARNVSYKEYFDAEEIQSFTMTHLLLIIIILAILYYLYVNNKLPKF